MTLAIIIPFRGTQGSKSRLDGSLSSEKRNKLLKIITNHVVAIANQLSREKKVYVLTKDNNVNFEGDFEVIKDAKYSFDLNQALEYALGILKEKYRLILMADLPYLNKEALDEVIAVLEKENKVVICPSQDQGTSILALTNELNIPLFFGHKSSQKFVAYCEKNNIPYKVLPNRLAFNDLDTQKDLKELTEKNNQFKSFLV